MAAFSYTYKIPGLYKTPAEIAGQVCQDLSDSPQGLSPEILLEASRDENAPLHNEFEWRDDVAAEKYRLNQAQGLIRNICVVVKRSDGSETKDRQFVITPGGKSAYVPLQSALSREDWHDHLLEQARNDCKAFLAKYRRLQALSGVTASMQAFLDEMPG